ncbi:phosphoenolpyruvate--protein phosphotransferase [Cereibacter sediminicola]|uniref:phosphoenolpyruvate--protein phosphotransferase n=1 Tax=Cereibacter sediminicola TaxID=2584941 RepID=UPI0011A67783|nr:phosphoenolpyruvate--protein phosphotransferase [Cereibacter sediminicola]
MTSLTAPGRGPRELITLDAQVATKHEAIAQVAAALVAAGCVRPGFEASMMRREAVSNTYLGKGIAIPHGTVEDRDLILQDAIAVLQVREGVEWNAGERARLVVAIAARSDGHIDILRRLTRLLQDEERLAALAATDDRQALSDALNGLAARVEAAGEPATDFAQKFDWTMDYPTGLHARPATEWAEAARRFPCRVRVRHGSEMADARNMISLLGLGLKQGDLLTVSAEGQGAAEALAAMKATLTGLSAREKADAARAEEKRRATAAAGGWLPSGAAQAVEGVPAAPGLAIGRIVRMQPEGMEIPDEPIELGRAADLLHVALAQTAEQLHALADDTGRRLGESDAAIFRAQAGLLADPDLITLASQWLVEGHGLAWSWHRAYEDMAARLSALRNPVLAARAADLRDVGRRVLAHIDARFARSSLSDLPEGTILVADDISPSDAAGLDADRVAGLVTALGGPTSHTAILARTLGLPAVVGAGAGVDRLESGTRAIIDGHGGRLWLDPGEEDLASARDWIAAEEARRARAAEARALPATTRDGHRIDIGANINLAEQAAFALEQGAEGVGLMRTEFLFLERSESPTEDEQMEAYSAMARALEGRPLVIRALDIGGDKQVTHLDLPREENPFLGVRGARLLLRRRDLLLPQLRAIYRAAASGSQISVMFPMVTSRGELLELRETCERIRQELAAPVVPLGIMVEVPSAALLAAELAAHADFFSIGTNDLTQYALAIDRQNPQLAAEADSLHPAVLRLIDLTVKGAEVHGRWVGVCGGIAGDPFGAALLAGLGVQELSMTPRDIPAVKERLRQSDRPALQALARRALACPDAEAVRALAAEAP